MKSHLKYLNKKTIVDGIEFSSKKEANYYQQLKLLQRAGEVIKFELQPEFVLQNKFKKNGKMIREIKYIADFLVEYRDGRKEIIDTKGFHNNLFRLKQKLFEYKFPDLELKLK